MALILLVSLFAGCANQDAPTASPTPTADAVSPTASATPTPEQTTDESGEMTFPLCDELTTFTIWAPSTMAPVAAGMTTPNDNTVYQAIEKKTNIHIDWKLYMTGSELESFNLIVSTGDYPDSFMSFTVAAIYPNGPSEYIEKEVILDLRDIIEQFCPNYLKAMKIDEVSYKSLMTDNGEIPLFRSIRAKRATSYAGGMVRQDWLDNAGYVGTPDTYDDWREMLTALKGQANIAPMYLASRSGQDTFMLAGFGASNGFLQINGKVIYSPITDEYKNYLITMNQWYEEGLIDPDFMTRVHYYVDSNMFINGDFGYYYGVYTIPATYEAVTGRPATDITFLSVPAVNPGDKRQVNYGIDESLLGGGNAAISTACSNPTLLAKWFDYFYYDITTVNWGLEGEAFEYVDGRPVSTDLIVNNPDGLSQSDAAYKYRISHLHPLVLLEEVEEAAIAKEILEARSIWDSDWDVENSYTIPELSMTADETSVYAGTYTDINTYVVECATKFITGYMDLSEWDNYVAQVKSMGIDKCIEVHQNALDRFNNR